MPNYGNHQVIKSVIIRLFAGESSGPWNYYLTILWYLHVKFSRSDSDYIK